MSVDQGDIIMIDNISTPVFVASTSVFNRAEMIIGCPVVKECEESVLHSPLRYSERKGIVLCEQLKFFDLKKRHYSVLSRTDTRDSMEVVDIIQGIVDYTRGQV